MPMISARSNFNHQSDILFAQRMDFPAAWRALYIDDQLPQITYVQKYDKCGALVLDETVTCTTGRKSRKKDLECIAK